MPSTIEDIPQEVSTSIILLLDVSDMLNCILVNQRWHQIITSTLLYQKIEIKKNAKRYHKAISLFKEKEHIGKSVKQLEMIDCEISMHAILTLPKYFSNLQELVWLDQHADLYEGGKQDDDYLQFPSNAYSYKEDFKAWRNIHSMSVGFKCLSIAPLILGSTTFTKLTKLDVSFGRLIYVRRFEVDIMKKLRPFVKHLLENIKNVPALEYFALRYCVLNLVDVEELHRDAPNLKELKLKSAYIHAMDSKAITVNEEGKMSVEGNRPGIALKPANSLQVFCLQFSVRPLSSSTETISKWLKYIGYKYTGIKKLSLLAIEEYEVAFTSALEQPIINLIHKLTNLISYRNAICPLTKAVMQAFDRNNCLLDEIMVRAEQPSDLKEQFECIQSSSQTATLNQFFVSAVIMHLKSSDFSPSFTSLAEKCANLVDLSINAIIDQTVFVDILQNLPNLERLKVDSFDIAEEYEEGYNLNTLQVKKCKLKQLHMGVYSEKLSNHEQVNSVFKFALASCPLLEDFTLDGDLSCESGAIKLHFLDHLKLKSISIEVCQVAYYTYDLMENFEGGKWAIDDRLLEGEMYYHIDLFWKGCIDLDLHC